MKKELSLIIASLIVIGCETPTTNNQNESNDNKTPTYELESTWLISKETNSNFTTEYSITDKSKELSNRLLIINEDGSCQIKSYGIRIYSNIVDIVETPQTVDLKYTKNDTYFTIGDDTYTYSFDDNGLVLESLDETLHFTSYTGIVPLREWTYDNILEFGFTEFNSIADIAGSSWRYESEDLQTRYSLYRYEENLKKAEAMVFHKYDDQYSARSCLFRFKGDSLEIYHEENDNGMEFSNYYDLFLLSKDSQKFLLGNQEDDYCTVFIRE